LTKSKGTTK